MAIEWHEHGESSKDGQWAIQTERLHHEPIWRVIDRHLNFELRTKRIKFASWWKGDNWRSER